MSLKSDQCLPLEYIQADASYHRQCWHVKVPRKFSFATDVKNPEWWRYNTLIKENDLVDLVGEAGDFDVTCRAVSVTKAQSFSAFCASGTRPKCSSPTQTGSAHVALVLGQGWTVFDASGTPIARYGDEDSAKKALAELPAAPATSGRGCRMKIREHVLVQPTGSIGGLCEARQRATRKFGSSTVPPGFPSSFRLPLRQPVAARISHTARGGRFPLCDPANFTIPSDEGAFLIRVYCPIGAPFEPTLWTCLSYFDARRPPVVSADRFHITGQGLKRILTDTLAEPGRVDKLRILSSRPRIEAFVRHDWSALALAPNCVALPRYMTIDANDPEASAKLQAFARLLAPAIITG